MPHDDLDALAQVKFEELRPEIEKRIAYFHRRLVTFVNKALLKQSPKKPGADLVEVQAVAFALSHVLVDSVLSIIAGVAGKRPDDHVPMMLHDTISRWVCQILEEGLCAQPDYNKFANPAQVPIGNSHDAYVWGVKVLRALSKESGDDVAAMVGAQCTPILMAVSLLDPILKHAGLPPVTAAERETLVELFSALNTRVLVEAREPERDFNRCGRMQ